MELIGFSLALETNDIVTGKRSIVVPTSQFVRVTHRQTSRIRFAIRPVRPAFTNYTSCPSLFRRIELLKRLSHLVTEWLVSGLFSSLSKDFIKLVGRRNILGQVIVLMIAGTVGFTGLSRHVSLSVIENFVI